MKHYIYKLTNIVTNKSYIGETKDWERRKCEHFRFISKGEVHENGLYEGNVEDWFFEVLEECDSSEKYQRESYWIHKYDTIINGYNIGDASSKPHTEETKKKIGEANKGKKLSEEAKEKISKARKGKKLSKEHREAISKGTKEAFKRPEVQKALKEAKEKLREDTEKYEEMKEKQSKSLKQYYIDNPEARKKLGHRIQIYMYNTEKILIKVFPSITEALGFLGVKGHTGLDIALKNNTIYKGYYWKKGE